MVGIREGERQGCEKDPVSPCHNAPQLSMCIYFFVVDADQHNLGRIPPGAQALDFLGPLGFTGMSESPQLHTCFTAGDNMD